jgi:hypothetical protein
VTEAVQDSAENASAVVAEPLKVEPVAPAVGPQPEVLWRLPKASRERGQARGPQEGQAEEDGERGGGGEEEASSDGKEAEVAV